MLKCVSMMNDLNFKTLKEYQDWISDKASEMIKWILSIP